MHAIAPTSLKNLTVADLNAATITLDHSGVSENTYRSHGLKSVEARTIYNQLVSSFPTVLEQSTDTWELIGITHDNGDNYRTATISVFYKGPPALERRTLYGVPDELLLIDAHTVKFELATKQSYLKVYQGDWWNIPLPALPPGACLATNFGMGRHFQKPELTQRRDVYFFHDNEKMLNTWLETMKIKPICATDLKLSTLGLYGLQFDASTLTPYKIKRYYQPHEPEIKDRLNL